MTRRRPIHKYDLNRGSYRNLIYWGPRKVREKLDIRVFFDLYNGNVVWLFRLEYLEA